MTEPEKERLIDVSTAESRLREFAHERDWEQFHNPKNLVLALVGEVGELAELFQWLTPEEADSFGGSLDRRAVEDELADVLQYVIRIADRLQVDLDESLRRKLKENAQRYPITEVKGSAVKRPRGRWEQPA